MKNDRTSNSFMDVLESRMSIISPVAMILLLVGFMAIVEPTRFFRLSNLEIILAEAAIYMPMAVAMTFVISQRGIDLSIGSVAALSAILMAFLMKDYGFPAWVAILFAICLGGTLGTINGLVVTKLRVPDLIGTLAMDLVYRGIALVLAKGVILARFPDLITEIGRGRIEGFIPIPVIIGIVCFAAGAVLLRSTFFGRYAIAVGSDPQTAEMVGIHVVRQKVLAYALMGAAAGLAGVMLTGKLNAIQATSAPFFNLHVIAAVVVGGTSLFGGRASLVGSFAGVIILSLITNALLTLRVEFFWQSVAAGVVIIFSVAAYSWLQIKDRDGAGNFFTSFALPENQAILRLFLGLLAALGLLLAIGFLFQGGVEPSG